MDITPFVDSLCADLGGAAEAAGPEQREAADRMLRAVEPALRLVLLEALSQAAAEITADLPAGEVYVRLRGRDPELVVNVPAEAAPSPSSPGPDDLAEPDEDDDAIARVSLRIPEGVKVRAEDLAVRNGQSLNAWIVSVLRLATSGRTDPGYLAGPPLPFGTREVTSRPIPYEMPRGTGGPRRLHGWA